MSSTQQSTIVDELARIFPGQIQTTPIAPEAPPVAMHVAAPEGGDPTGLTRAEIKTALNDGLKLPALDAHPDTKARFAAEVLNFANQRSGLLSQVGGPVDERPVELNRSYSDALTRQAELSGRIETAKAAEDVRKAALAAEPASNEALAKRVAALAGGSFGTGYFDAVAKAVQPPVEDPGAGLVARDQARAEMARTLGIAEAFKAALSAVGAAEATLAGYPKPLHDGFAAARPVTPAGIATAADLATAEKATPALAPWATQVAGGAAYVTAGTEFDAAHTAAQAGTWPANVVAALARVRQGADGLAGAAAREGSSLTPACDALVAGRATMEAAGRFTTVQRRVDAARAKFPALLTGFSAKLGTLATGVTDDASPTAAKFDAGIVALEKAEASVPDALAYAGLYPAAVAHLKKFDAALNPPVAEEVKKAADAVRATLAEAAKQAASFTYDAAIATVTAAETALDAAVATRVASAATSPRATQMHNGLKDAKDASGQDLASALYLEFGDAGYDAFLQNVTGLQKGAVIGTSQFGMNPELAVSNLKVLGTSVGATGLKALTGALGGTDADSDLVGARNLGGIMTAGMSAKQVGEMHGMFGMATDASALQGVFGTAFSGDPRVFGTIVSRGLRGKRTVATPDVCVTNLKRLSDAFADKTQLRQVVRGLTSPDLADVTMTDFPDLDGNERTKMDSVLKDSAAERGAARMDNLVATHFGGDPAKLKTPFFDQIQGHPSAEFNALDAARLAHETWVALPLADQTTRPAPVYSAQMQQRYAVLKASYRGGVNKELLIRTAATLQCGIKPPNIPIGGRGVPIPKSQNNNVVSEADDQAHFEDRHLRSCNPLDGRALAPDSTLPSQPKLSKPTTFWPEVVTPALLKTLLKSAVAQAGKPPGDGWIMSADDESSNYDRSRVVVTSFGQKNVTLSFPVSVKDKQVTRTIKACVGMARITETVTPKAPAGGRGRAPRPNAPVVTYRVSQFYPLGDGTDTLSFESMQTIKAALGKRNWKS